MRVDRERLVAYQRLCGYAVGDTLPQPYPWVLAFPLQTALMARADFPLPLPGMVHLANRRHHPPGRSTPASRSRCRSRPGASRPHRRGRTLDVRLEAHVDDELVWECDSRLPQPGPRLRRRAAWRRPARRPGRPAVARWRLPDDLGRSYASVSGDVNPIHLHPLGAKALGFPRHLAHGMWT